MYQKILLAYDGTRAGRAALKQGADLAISCQADVILLAVISPKLGVTLAETVAPCNLPDRIEAEVENILAEGAEKLRQKGLAVKSMLASGNPTEEIARIAHEMQTDLIVVGHKSQSTLSRWWMGSVDASLLNCTPCSILVAVLPPEAKTESP